ncbi:TPA: hypothetical protein DCW38_02570 [candidate division WOR-3 bacterium]|uniref:Uncharacterized protein n=1 Tax=candidate division WOR-3 bacterium TaxID=2052148 RepID=A0A350H931_UNCW3|nr:hypothetical protein [candidate division WOR-3 bacterium]
MKHIDPVKLSALADNEYTLNEREIKHLRKCKKCEKNFLDMKSLKQTVKSAQFCENADFDIIIDYNQPKKNREIYALTFKMSFTLLFLVSFITGIVITGTIKKDNENYSNRNEFNEMGSKYAGKQYVFPFK